MGQVPATCSLNCFPWTVCGKSPCNQCLCKNSTGDWLQRQVCHPTLRTVSLQKRCEFFSIFFALVNKQSSKKALPQTGSAITKLLKGAFWTSLCCKRTYSQNFFTEHCCIQRSSDTLLCSVGPVIVTTVDLVKETQKNIFNLVSLWTLQIPQVMFWRKKTAQRKWNSASWVKWGKHWLTSLKLFKRNLKRRDYLFFK